MDILTETQHLWQRFQNGNAFKDYLRQRLVLVVPALAVFFGFSLATTAGTIIALGGTRSILVLAGLLLAPVVLLGTLYVQGFVFFAWLENRAIEKAKRRAPRAPKDELRAAVASLRATVAPYPVVVLAIGAAVLLGPLALVATLSTALAVLLLLAIVATPLAFALLDRA